MLITKSQLERIAEIIARRFNAFTFEALGPRSLTDDELRVLQEAGLLREGTRHLIMDPVVLGRITALLPLSARKEVTYDSVLAAASKVPMTEVERQAIEFATAHAGEHIRGIRDLMIRDVKAITARASDAALRKVQESVADSIKNRTTISELKTTLFDAIDDRERDWKRVAHTEINTAIQQGVYRSIRDASDARHEQLVFKKPNPDACKHCKRVYLMPDGVTPRVFRLADLADSNVGLKAHDWKPVIGSVHPWCFTGGHRIETSRGQIPIEKVRVGDLVKTHLGRFQRVTRIYSREWSGDLVVLTVGERSLASTPNHPHLVGGRWVPASNLRKGDYLFESPVFKIPGEQIDRQPSATPVAIISVKRQAYSGKVFNLEVEVDNSYVCEGIITHNCGCQLQVVPEGFDFVRTRVVTEDFEFEGREFRRGEIVDPGIYDRLEERLKNHVGIESVLAYTGKTAALSVEKSFASEIADCSCEHD